MAKEGLITRTGEPGRLGENPLADNLFTVPVYVDLDPIYGTVTYSALNILPKGVRAGVWLHTEKDNPTPVDELYFKLRGGFWAIRNGRHQKLVGDIDLARHRKSRFFLQLHDPSAPLLKIVPQRDDPIIVQGLRIPSGTVHGNYSIEGEGACFLAIKVARP